ncbi:MAG: thiamine pyrophosphate-binding protein [Clostridia bacterium]
MRGADLLARTLAAGGVKHVFTLSGNHVMPVFDAALDAKLSLLHVRHEAAAVHMADAWGRLTGEPGIALVTGGPGHANAVSALYTALAAESPLVLISGHAPLGELGKGAFQEMRQADVAAPLCKASWTARSAATLGEEVARAWREAISGRPGPVHLSVPSDLLDEAVDGRLPPSEAFLPSRKGISIQEADFRLDLIGKARAPVVLAGPALMNADGPMKMKRLEEALGVPVIGMESPRGVKDPSLGRLAQVLSSADLVVSLGKRVDFTLGFGRPFSQARLVALPDDVDSRAACDLLLERAKAREPSRSGWHAEARAALAYRPPEWASLRSKPEGPAHAVEVCREVQKLLDVPDAILVCDGGEFGQWSQACVSAPRRIINGPAGSIGSALPLAAAAKLASPGSTVVAMMGDGTFGFHATEIDTAVRYGLPFVAVVGNDACWNAEYQIQLRAYGKERAHGLDLLPTRYGAVAAALGGPGEDVTRPGELAAALGRALKSGRPACVNVAIERVAAPSY